MKAELEKERLEMEKKFLKDQEDLKLRMEAEAKEREAKEKEFNQRMEKNNECGRNEVIQLFEKVKKDLIERKKENEELRDMLLNENGKRSDESKRIEEKLAKERKDLKDFMSDEESFANLNLDSSSSSSEHPCDLVCLLRNLNSKIKESKKDNEELKNKINNDKSQLESDLNNGDLVLKEMLKNTQDDIERKMQNQDQQSKDLEKKLAEKMLEDGDKVREMREVLLKVQSKVDVPYIYFTAVREEPYCTGGEEYLTFSHCALNTGECMDPKSGVFTASVGGKDHIYRMVIVEGCCTMARSSLLRSKLFIG